MLLGIDVGNTNIVYGVFDGAELIHRFRVETGRGRTADEYAVVLRQLLAMRGVEASDIQASILASVVPALTEPMIGLVRAAFGHDPVVVGPGVKSGMPILYENPREVGADRIVNAVAAFERYGTGLIVVEVGQSGDHQLRGDFPGSVPTHTVGEGQQPRTGVDRVFVVGAYQAAVAAGRVAEDQCHGRSSITVLPT